VEITLQFDVDLRRSQPDFRLTPKQFGFLLYLALRRTDGSRGYVSLTEIVERAPRWQGQSASSAGKEIWRFSVEKSWFAELVEAEKPNIGPYRLYEEATFHPSREAAHEFVFANRMPRTTRTAGKHHQRRIGWTELQAYDLLIQYGVYIPALIDLILQRIGQPEKLAGPMDRLAAFRILATLHKNRGAPALARQLAERGLVLARKMDQKDDVAYLLDQIGGTLHIDGRDEEARKFFREEIDFLKQWGTPRSEFHLAGAYRGLAGTLRGLGDIAGARTAIAESRRFAGRSGNEQALRLAIIEEARLRGEELSEDEIKRLLTDVPTEHLVGRVMAMTTTAERLLKAGDRVEGKRLLGIARQEAERLGLKHGVERCDQIAGAYLDDQV